MLYAAFGGSGSEDPRTQSYGNAMQYRLLRPRR